MIDHPGDIGAGRIAKPTRLWAGVLAVAGLRLLVHVVLGGEYGWHRDELLMLDNARHLAWGYVAYPPLAPLVARVGLELFGPSMVGVRLLSALAQALVVVLAGDMARQLGGTARAQALAAVAVAIAPISVLQGVLFQYVSFDFLWWVLLTWLAMRLLATMDPRWWLPIGAVIGAGMMTKYTILVLVAGLVGAFLVAGPRHHLRSRWLWLGVLASLLIVLPNVVWQAQHGFITADFLETIHARDVAIGRTEGFVLEQLFIGANPFTIPIWIAGLSFYLVMPEGRRFRMLGWTFVLTFALMVLARGRSYYLAPAYPMLLAAGAVVWERWLAAVGSLSRRLAHVATWVLLAAGATMSAVLMLPLHPIGSPLWTLTSGVHDNFVEQIGWPELVATVADVYRQVPAEERPRTAILAGNYGEAGAVNLYGPAHGLPRAISGVNSYWLRGFGDPPPDTAIVLGIPREHAEQLFEQCTVAGRVTNRHGVQNEESVQHPEVLLCRRTRAPWSEMWPRLRAFG